ncbi:endonuclease G [Rhodoferax sp. OV413]|uniref:DNA/RNA non-specific endonuclease n=1 Tax=Rhodoferax sp. OV413 TaxID=1855285 RepID=UPI000888D485|nr:DNA/RNA non-specific endonuclease [Rhodoferax sp. OV413]SDP94263.1 endonuclease G [Rhodoferax sp. OV413]
MIKKKSRKRRSAGANPRHSQHLPSATVRRFGIALITAGIVAIQTTSCGLQPTVSGSRTELGKTTASSRFAACPQFFTNGIAPMVPGIPQQRELCYEGFAVLHNGSTRTPAFVAERLNRQLVLQARTQKRTDKFFADARLPQAERAELSDYKGSGYSRGHMAPAADMFNTTAMEQSFSLANVVPQNPQQNAGAWAKIEEDTRAYVMRAQGDVYVITGPVFAPGSPVIGANQVRVPTHLFKLVYDATTKRAWAHWQQNSAEARPGPPITYGELEQRTGMEWLPGAALR